MNKRKKITTAAVAWFNQALFGLSLSLLASGVVSSLMSSDKIIQYVLLYVISFLGMKLSLLCRILPILLEKEGDK